MRHMLTPPAFRQEFVLFLKFAIVGGLGTVTDICVLNLLHQFAGFSLFWANTVSFSTALMQNFLLHRHWTFPSRANDVFRVQLAKFALICVIGLGLSQLVFLGLHTFLLPYWTVWINRPDLADTVSYNAAKMVSICVILTWNFGANRLWTFRT